MPKEDAEEFAKMNQDEKLAYLEGRIPHEPGREAEAHIQASLVLSSINRLATEIGLIDEELDIIKTQEETEKEVEKTNQEARKEQNMHEIKNFNGLG